MNVIKEYQLTEMLKEVHFQKHCIHTHTKLICRAVKSKSITTNKLTAARLAGNVRPLVELRRRSVECDVGGSSLNDASTA